MRERWKAARWGQWNRPETVRLQGVGAGSTLHVMPSKELKLQFKKLFWIVFAFKIFLGVLFVFYMMGDWFRWIGADLFLSEKLGSLNRDLRFGRRMLECRPTHLLHHIEYKFHISFAACCPSRRAYWRMSQRVDLWSRLSPLPGGATGKPSMNSAFVL